MPWNPTPQEEAALKQQIKQRFGYNDLSNPNIPTIVNHLKQAKGKKQAEAVLALATANQIRDLATYQLFDTIANNSPATINAALTSLPNAVAAAQALALQVQQDNMRINGYLNTVTGAKFTQHRQGQTINLPIQDMVNGTPTVIARHYANGEQRLPNGGSYAEWYPLAGGLRSAQKRFFTCSGDRNSLWYTEGGTHGAGTWWQRMQNNGSWQRM